MLIYKEPKIKVYRRSVGLCLDGLDEIGIDVGSDSWSSNILYINASVMKTQKYCWEWDWKQSLKHFPPRSIIKLFGIQRKRMPPLMPPPPPRDYKHVISLFLNRIFKIFKET